MTKTGKPAIKVRVREVCGAYVTATVRGRRASCTHSAQEAAIRLAGKVFERSDVVVRRLEGCEAPGVSMWSISEP